MMSHREVETFQRMTTNDGRSMAVRVLDETWKELLEECPMHMTRGGDVEGAT